MTNDFTLPARGAYTPEGMGLRPGRSKAELNSRIVKPHTKVNGKSEEIVNL